MIENFDALAVCTTISLAQNLTGPRGVDLDKISPVGLLIIVVLLIVIPALGWDLSRRTKCLATCRKFAETYGVDPFDSEAVDKTMAIAGQCREAG